MRSGRLLRGSTQLLVGQTAATLLAVLQGILLARLLGPAGYGVVALVTTFTALLTRFFDARSWETAVKYLTEFVERREYDTGRAVLRALLAIDVLSSAVTWVVLFLLAPWGARLVVEDPAGATLIRLYGLTVFALAPFGLAQGLLRIADRYRSIAFLLVSTALVELVLTVGAVVWAPSLRRLMGAFVLAAAVRVVLGLTSMARCTPALGLEGWWRAPLGPARGRLGEVGRYWASSNVFAVLKGIHQSVDTLLVGSFLGPAPAGLFRTAKNLSQAVSFPLTPLFQASFPELVRLHGTGREAELAHLYRRLLLWGAAAASVVGVGVALLAQPLIVWTAGPDYAAAAPTLRWLAAGVAVTAATQFGHALLMAQRRLGAVFQSFAVPLVVQIGLLLALVPLRGQVAAGWAFLGFAAVRGAQLLFATRHALRPRPGT